MDHNKQSVSYTGAQSTTGGQSSYQQSTSYSTGPVVTHTSHSHGGSTTFSSGAHGRATSSTYNMGAIVSTAQNTRKVSEVVTSDQLVLPKNAYEQSSRKVSSVVVFEEEEKMPEKNIRYVEVPQYEEVIKTVAVREERIVEKIVPKIVEEWVEKIVEIPQIEEVIRHVEVPQIVEEIKHVPKIEVVDRPYEVIKEVPVVSINKVEKVVELGAETIEVPKAAQRTQTVSMTTYNDSEAMLVVGQKIRPVIIDGAASAHGGSQLAIAGAHGTATIDMCEYSPEVMPVDIHVAKFVDQDLVMTGVTESWHKVVTVSAAQYNSMLRYLNKHLSQQEIDGLPFLTGHNGQVDFLPQDFNWQSPQEGLKIYGYRQGQVWGQGSVVRTAKYSSGMSQQEMQMKQQELDRQFQQIFSQFESEAKRRTQAIESFNQQQVEKVRAEMSRNNQNSRSYGQKSLTAFDMMDRNGDGVVTRDEFNQGMSAIRY